MKKLYYLVDPNDDSGNDGILDAVEMTSEEATELNQQRRQRGSDCRWILARPAPSSGITHIDEIDPTW